MPTKNFVSLCSRVLCGGLAAALLTLPALADATAQTTTTRYSYKAFLSGTLAGDVVVDVTRGAGVYTVKGRAATTGFWRAIDDWEGDFQVEGELAEGAAVPGRYVLLEKSSRKEQHVVVSDGELFVTKNGKVRKPKPAHPGLDLVSALWVVADCVDNAQLHNGRHGYQVERSQLDDGSCRYEVENDDGDRYSANVRFAEHSGQRVLESLVVNRLVGTRLTLVDVEQLDGALAIAPEASVAAVTTPAADGSPAVHSQADPGADPVADTAL